jgi:hypothetical protein
LPFPTFIIGPTLNTLTWARRLHQSRRRVKLTVHRAALIGPMASIGGGPVIVAPTDSYFITVTNASRDRDIEVTHVWLQTEPPVHVHDPDLPKRLKYSARWETSVPVKNVPADPARVPWLARCQLSPDDKVVKSRPRRNVPPSGAVARG